MELGRDSELCRSFFFTREIIIILGTVQVSDQALSNFEVYILYILPKKIKNKFD